jgi:curved DNA-binding protein
MNYYETLGIANTATQSDIKLAYRKLAKKHHPDLGGDVAKFQQINEAYEILNDSSKKTNYDISLKHAQSQPKQPNFADHMYHDDQFNQMFGFGFRAAHVPRNRNIVIQIEVDFRETLDECQKNVEFNLSRGIEKVTINIPAGILDQTILNMAGRGDNSILTVPRGALEIIVRVRPDTRFVRIDDNVLSEITIDCFQSITGIDHEVITPRNKKIKVTIPPGTQSGTQLGISNEGFVRPNRTYGKFIIKVNVVIPSKVSSEQMLLVRQIQRMRSINT